MRYTIAINNKIKMVDPKKIASDIFSHLMEDIYNSANYP